MSAYYNENDRHAAAWLRELIRRGLIAPGDVDDRSILDVRPDDLRGYDQCHFFAGIGGWSYALRLAGWPDDRPVWTGSCPCQPFSVAGAQRGSEDERHLWPAFFDLICECRPATVFGEQVAGAAGLAWLDHVCSDLEGAGYAVAAADLPACGIGAPHRRQRLWWVADDISWGRDRLEAARAHERRPGAGSDEQAPRGADGTRRDDVDGRGELGSVADDQGLRRDRQAFAVVDAETDRGEPRRGFNDDGEHGVMGDAGLARLQGHVGPGDMELHRGSKPLRSTAAPGPTSGFWSDAEWLPCRDGKSRPVEPGTFPLAHGLPARVVRLRGYGNAIVAPLAAEFVRAYMTI